MKKLSIISGLLLSTTSMFGQWNLGSKTVLESINGLNIQDQSDASIIANYLNQIGGCCNNGFNNPSVVATCITDGFGFYSGCPTIYAYENLFTLNRSLGIGIANSSPSIKLRIAGGDLRINGNIKIDLSNVLELGSSISGKEVNAGKIGYGTPLIPNSLNIVGAGTTTANRRIDLIADGGVSMNSNLDVLGNVGVGAVPLAGAKLFIKKSTPTANENFVHLSSGNLATAAGDRWNSIGDRIPFATSAGYASTGHRAQWDQFGSDFGLVDRPSSTVRDGLIAWQDLTTPNNPLILTSANSRLRFVFRNSKLPSESDNANEVMTMLANGNIGVGAIPPTGAKLFIRKSSPTANENFVHLSSGNLATAVGDRWNSVGDRIPFVTNAGYSSTGHRAQWDQYGVDFGLVDRPSSTIKDGLIAWQDATPSNTTNPLTLSNTASSRLRFVYRNANIPSVTPNANEVMSILANGNIGVGITAPTTKFHVSGNTLITGRVTIGNPTLLDQGYELSVVGEIRAREVDVNNLSWSDFVFKDDYKLPTIIEVEKYIKEKGHLPAIPSAKEVADKGYGLSSMDAKLLQKIEELTLYIIAQEKRSLEQENRIKKLESISK